MTETSQMDSTPGGELQGEAVLRAVYARDGAALYRLALQMTGDSSTAASVVEETFVRAWRRGDFGDPAVVGADLADRMSALAQDVARELGGDHEASPSAAALRNRAAVDEAMLRISDEHRQVIVETYLAGRGFDALAAEVAVPTRTLRDRAFYALKALRQALEETGAIR